MKNCNSFLTRCLAMALALVLIVSSANLGVVFKAKAAGDTTVSAGEIVANNYELTEEEKALLNSGLLAGETITYTAPSNGDKLIIVDTENSKITAKTEGKWKPIAAKIVKNGAVVETVTLNSNGEGKYDPAVGNAFSVVVEYVLYGELDIETHTNLLMTAGWLKNDLEGLKAAYATDVNLGTLALAMDILENLANGFSMNFGTGGSLTVKFGEEAITAVKTLSAQTEASNGQLELQVMNAAYNASASKTQYLLVNGATYKGIFDETAAAVKAIVNDPLTNNSILDSYLQSSEPAGYTQWMAFKKIMNNLVAAMEPVAATDWIAASRGTTLVASNVDYVALDNLVTNLKTITVVPSLATPLVVATADVQKNLSMYNVTVKVVLNTVEDKADSAVLVKAEAEPVVLTLAAGATAEQVAAEAEDVIEEALAALEGYVDGQFEVKYSTLPGALDADIDYVVTYSPKAYTVTYEYATDAPASVPYGYQMTLPAHENVEQAYDYTVNGKAYAQGEIIVIEGNTEISRSAGKAYTATDLYTIIADNYGNDVAKAILKSGALLGNEAVNVRKPDPADAASLLKLIDGILSADDYDAAYNDLNWNANTYGENGTENAFSGTTASWDNKSVKVQYKLTLSNYSEAQVAEILELAAQLKSEADAQTSTLDAFAANTEAMGQLDKTKLGALNGVIDVTDFTPGDGTETDEANVEMQKYFKSLVSGIIANNLDANNYLKIYNMLGNYNNEGLRYYYVNSAAILAEIDSLAGYLSGMLADDEKIDALKIMVTAAGFPEYAGKIIDLEAQLNSVKESLTAPNAAIDLASPNMGALITALTAEGEVVTAKAGSPYLLSEVLMATDSSQVYVQIIIDAGKAGTATVVTEAMDRNTVLTQDVVNGLKASVDEKVNELLGTNAKYYNLSASVSLDALVGKELSAIENVYYTYTAKEFKATIMGENPQIVTIEDLEIDLPKHETAGWEYRYTIDGVEGITTSTYTFTPEQLDRLFTNGLYDITRTAVNEAAEKLEKLVATLNEAVGAPAEKPAFVLVSEGNAYTGITGTIGMADMMNFVMGLVNGGYPYVGLNDDGFKYLNEEDSLEVSLQSLINAVLSDESFNNDAVIALGENGKGKILTVSMQLGNSVSELEYSNLTFTLNLNSVPEQLKNNVDIIKNVSSFIQFQSNDGVMAVEVTLPDQVYAAYAAALVATGHVDKTDVNEMNQKVALQFLKDYLDAITGSEMDMTTFTNTLKKLGVDKNLTPYNKYYVPAMDAYNEYVKIEIIDPTQKFRAIPTVDPAGANLSISVPGKLVIDKLIGLTGMDVSSVSTFLPMLKEYKDGNNIELFATGSLTNTEKTYYALIADVQADGMTNKFEAPSSYSALAAETASLAGYSAMILLDNVPGDLTISGTTILDLNGKNVEGTINATGKLYIIDSLMDTYNAGTVNAVKGNAVIVAGNYKSDVSSFLKEGYYMDGTTVRNAMYKITTNGDDVTFVLNGDFYESEYIDGYMPNATALAIDIASDLALNYGLSASLSVDGYSLIDVKVEDLIGLVAGDNKAENLIKETISWFTIGEEGYENNDGFEAVVNLILEDILDFGAITTALNNDSELATYKIGLKPWTIDIVHITDGNYASLYVGSSKNPDLAKNFNVSLIVESKYNGKIAELTGELAEIVEDETTVQVDIPTPEYANKEVTIKGAGKAIVSLDMTKNDYATMIGVILAYGNSSKRAAVAEAINNGDMDALKAVVDNTSVKELFTALKMLARNVNFTKMATDVGVTVDVSSAADLEAVYHLYLCAVGKALEELDITGMDSKLGGLYNKQTGYYELSKKDIFRDKELSARGYSALVELEVTELTLKVKLFGEEACMIGDVNHDGKVTVTDVALVEEKIAEMDPVLFCFRGADVNGDGKITVTDAGLIREYLAELIEVFPAETK